MSRHFPLPVPVLSALQYLSEYETRLNGRESPPTELTDSICILSMFVAHVTNTDYDHLFDMVGAVGTAEDSSVVVEINQYHEEPEVMQ